MHTTQELRDDFVSAIALAIEDEEVVTSAVSVASEGNDAFRVTYENGKTFRVTIEDITPRPNRRLPRKDGA